MKKSVWVVCCAAAAFSSVLFVSGPVLAQCGQLSCVPFADPVCDWDPFLNNVCKVDVPAPSSCKCTDYTTPKTCTPVSESYWLDGGAFIFLSGIRPGGLCANIPCGECYNLETRECAMLFVCQNQYGGTWCGPQIGECELRYVGIVMKTEYFETDHECCIDFG